MFTALTNELRIWRVNAGMTFALLKRQDMSVSEFFRSIQLRNMSFAEQTGKFSVEVLRDLLNCHNQLTYLQTKLKQ